MGLTLSTKKWEFEELSSAGLGMAVAKESVIVAERVTAPVRYAAYRVLPVASGAFSKAVSPVAWLLRPFARWLEPVGDRLRVVRLQ
jgi:hypothetical protein